MESWIQQQISYNSTTIYLSVLIKYLFPQKTHQNFEQIQNPFHPIQMRFIKQNKVIQVNRCLLVFHIYIKNIHTFTNYKINNNIILETMKKQISTRQSKKQKIFSSNQQQISSHLHDHVKQKFIIPIQSNHIDQLYLSKDKLKIFSNKIGIDKFTPLREDVLEHCEKVKSKKNENLNYEKIQKMVKYRIEKMIKNKRIKKNWSQEDIYILIWIISKYCDFIKIGNIDKGLQQHDWKNISELIPGTDQQSCMFKWLSLKKNKLSDYNWSEKQSATLNKIVKQNQQQDWTAISQQLYYMNNSTSKVYRCPKQCREHWNCYLNPRLKKGPWTTQQDITLLCQIKRKNGLKKWSDMIKLFNGRTQNALKNRYNLIIQKQKKQIINHHYLSQLDLINHFLQRNQILDYSNSNLQIKIQSPKSKNYHLQQQSSSSSPSISQEIVQKRVLRKRSKKIQMLDSSYNQQQQLSKVSKVKVDARTLQFKNNIIKQAQHSPAMSIPEAESVQDFEISPPFQIRLNNNETPLPKQLYSHHYYHHPYQFPPSLFPKTHQIPTQCSDLVIKQNMDVNDILPTDLKKIKIVPMKQHDMIKLKQILSGLSKGTVKDLSFVPCKIIQNKLTKFNY